MEGNRMDERNWFRKLDHSWACDRMNGCIQCSRPHLIIEFEQGKVRLDTFYSGRILKTENFRTKEEIDGFIKALKETRDIVFK